MPATARLAGLTFAGHTPNAVVYTPTFSRLYPLPIRNGRVWTQLPALPAVVLGLPALVLRAGNPHG